MNEIYEYVLATGADSEQLGHRVSELLAQGWQPFGSPVARNEAWGQAMVKAKIAVVPHQHPGSRFRRMGE